MAMRSMYRLVKERVKRIIPTVAFTVDGLRPTGDWKPLQTIYPPPTPTKRKIMKSRLSLKV